MSRHLHLTGLAVVITVFAGIMGTGGAPEPERSPGIAYLRARLVADLHGDEAVKLADSLAADSLPTVYPGRIAFDSVPSRVVPGLMFLEARERLRAQAPAYAVVGVRGAQSRVVHTWADLVALAGSWRPTTSREAIGLCTEAVALASEARHPELAPFAYGVDGDTLPDALSGRAAIADVVVPPVARRAGTDAWRVSFWSIEAGRTRLYDCRVAAGADRLGILMTVADSLPGAGLAPR